MTLQEIKSAISDGKKVHWSNELYDVVKDKYNQYFIICTQNKHAIGLTWIDEKTMNGKEGDFYVE